MAADKFVKESLSVEKTDYTFIEPKWLEGVADVLTFGAKKYSRDNWKKCKLKDLHLYYAALYRHTEAMRMGEVVDPETGLKHAYHASCNLMFIEYIEERGK